MAYFTASCDTAEVNKRFAESMKVDYPILSDPEGPVAKAYGVIDAKRKNASRWTFIIGRDGKILHIDKKVKPATHAEDVVEKLRELKKDGKL